MGETFLTGMCSRCAGRKGALFLVMGCPLASCSSAVAPKGGVVGIKASLAGLLPSVDMELRPVHSSTHLAFVTPCKDDARNSSSFREGLRTGGQCTGGMAWSTEPRAYKMVLNGTKWRLLWYILSLQVRIPRFRGGKGGASLRTEAFRTPELPILGGRSS